MKYRLLLLPLLICSSLLYALPPQSQADREDVLKKLDGLYDIDELPERLANYRMEYIQAYDMPFEDVFNTVVSVLDDFQCRAVVSKQSMDDDGYFKGVIKSDYCVFVRTSETTDVDVLDSLELYSVKVPFIRGGIWETGRMKYTFIMREQEDGSTSVEIRGEISGRESLVTDKIHFWESNGTFETAFLNNVSEKLEK